MAGAGCWWPRPWAWARSWTSGWSCLLDAGVDAVAVDTAHGHSAGVLNAIRRIKMIAPSLPVLAGNVVTAEGAAALIDAGADAVKVGVGAGSICTTRIVAGAGLPQLTAIAECAEVARRRGIPVIADGGIKYSGDIVKALAAGADAVMLGSLLAGLEESPGEVVIYEGRRFKEYRGMGSLGAMKGRASDRYATAQGDGGRQARPGRDRGPGAVQRDAGGLRLPAHGRSALRHGLCGRGRSGRSCADKARFARITNAGLIESHPHDFWVTKEAPNYQAAPVI